MTTPVAVYLASQSPRRRELLSQIGIAHHVLQIDIDETPRRGELPRGYVARMAREKAAAGVQQLGAGHARVAVIGADTIGTLGERLLIKPADRADGLAMLRAMSGQTHQVITAVCVTDGQRSETAAVVSDVRFRELSDAEIERYWDSGEPADKAGAYAIQGRGALFVEHISGSYSAVVGLPLCETARLLAQFGVVI